MDKLRVGVLMGGKSIEKEVSFNSGRTICDHLDTARYSIVPLFQHQTGKLYLLPWHFLYRGKIRDFEHRLPSEAQCVSWDGLKKNIDFMYIATHGHYAEDGILQGFLEVLKIPYLGSKVLASALGMDKIIQKQLLQSHGIIVPRSLVIYPEKLSWSTQNQEALLSALRQINLNLPYIIKPYKEGSSLGITLVTDSKDLLTSVMHAATIDPYKAQPVLIEEYITGLEFTCIILTNYKTGEYIALPPTEIVPEQEYSFFDYAQKYMPGRATKFTPARCSQTIIKAIQDTCIQVMGLLNIHNLARIDGFVTQDNTIVITDPNTLSGMAPSSFIFRQAAELNMSHTQVINHLIETELAYYTTIMPTALYNNQDHNNIEQKSKKIRVAVLLGGNSHEKEISLESGRNIFYKLSPYKYEPIAIFVDSDLELYKINQALLVRGTTKEIELGLDPSMKLEWDQLKSIADFVFIGLHGGKGENGCVQGTLEMLEIPYNGSSVLSSALCMDKYKTTQYLKSHGFAVPQNMLISLAQWEQNQQDTLESISRIGQFPLIVKPHDDGCSVLVQKSRTTQELIQAIEAIFADGKKYALIEEFITGMELTVGVIGNATVQALPPSQTVTKGDILSIEEKFLPGAGENQTPAPLSQNTLLFVQETIAQVYKTLNCKGYARIDCFYQNAQESRTNKEQVIILEVNTLPGMTPATCIFHQAAEVGIKPMDFIDMIIQLGFDEHTQQQIKQEISSPKDQEQLIANS